MTTDAPAPRDRLALPGGTAGTANGVSKTAAGAKPAATEPLKRPHAPFDPGRHVREFQFLDGRPISIHRAGVRFACPLKTDLEGATLVGLKEGASPCPLKIPYADFKAWWFQGKQQRK